MDGKARRPRTRGPRSRRGGSRPLPAPAVVTEEVAVARDRNGRRGGRADLRRPHDLTIDISEMPVGQGLETPLHAKRLRTSQSSNLAPAPPPPTASTSSVSETYQVEVNVKCESVSGDEVSPPLSPTFSEPSLAMNSSRCEGEISVRSTSPSSAMQSSPRVRKSPRDEDNYGSKADSDESDDDELVSPFIPRVYRSALETPMDAEDNQFSTSDPAAGDDSVPAAASTFCNIDPPMAMDQPCTYDFQWRAFPNPPIQPESRRETFSESNVGPTTPCVDPYDIFVAIWDQQFMEHIVSETNRYAKKVATDSLQSKSHIGRWCDTTADELYVYFGLIIAMGVVLKSRLEEYWNVAQDVFYTPGFSAHMSINRFILLNKCLHFNNNEDMCAAEMDVSEAKVFKIQPVLSHLNTKFQSLYTLKQNIVLDESLLQWTGWLENNQFIPKKAAKVGIRTYEICESQTGYLWRFEVHAHKKSPAQQLEDTLNESTPTIVLRLTHGLENKGYTLWINNFYNSPCLARRLKALGFDCVGTLRTNRKFVPPALHSLTNENMRPGQIAGFTSGDVDVMVYRDSNRMAMISTYHGNAATQVRDSTKPILILDYNIMMAGVDKKDQMLAMYPIERKQTKVWYKKLFRRLLNVSVLNSYIIHHQSPSALSHRNFRIALVKSLLSKHSSASAAPLPSVTKQNKSIDLTHRLAVYPFVGYQRHRRVCKICKSRVQTFCVGCNKAVCIDACFLTMHS